MSSDDDIKKLAEAMTDDDDIVPAPTPPQPIAKEQVIDARSEETPVKPTKKGKGGGSGSTSLRSLLPAVDRVRIWKRRQDGRTSYIGEYGGRDLERKGSIEVFLHEYVMPTWGGPGPNDFLIYLVKADGQQYDAGEITLEGPPQPASKETSTLQELADLQKKMAQEAAAAKADPMDQLMKFMTFQEKMNKSGGMDPLMMMMFMQQMQQPKGPSASDMILEKIARRLDALERDREMPMMPSPFPTPTPDPGHSLIEAMGKLAEIMKPTQQQATSPMDIISIVKALTPSDAIGAKDILPMLNSMKDLTRAPDKNYIKETLESLEMLRKARDILEPPQEGGTFWDFLRDMVNPDNVGALRDMMGNIRAKEQQNHPAPAGLGASPIETPPPNVPAAQTPPFASKPNHFEEFPNGFASHAKRINEAKDAAASVEAVMVALNSLPRSAPYQPFVDKMIGLSLASETDKTKKEPALDYVQTFLESMLTLDMITQDKADQAIQAFEEHWDEIVSTLRALISQARAASEKKDGKPTSPEVAS